jgi:hypothetical protein
MFRDLFARSSAAWSALSRSAPSRSAEIRPPATPSSFGRRHREDAIAAARLDFCDALDDIHTPAAAMLLDRIGLTRSLHDLWHMRGELFAHVSRCHDQAEAGRRLAALDGHFAKRSALARWRDAGRATTRPAEL